MWNLKRQDLRESMRLENKSRSQFLPWSNSKQDAWKLKMKAMKKTLIQITIHFESCRRRTREVADREWKQNSFQSQSKIQNKRKTKERALYYYSSLMEQASFFNQAPIDAFI